MKRLLLAASLMLAFSVSPASALGHTAEAGFRTGACLQHYWMWPGIRYAHRVYAGSREPSGHAVHRLWHMDKCQHNKHARLFLRGVIKRQRLDNRQRHEAASHPWYHSVVSWYYDGGQTASGFHATYGVADCGTDGVCYPFGTQIEFCYHGCVVATVDDHGPYVAGRDYDLNQNTAQAIGFGGVGTVAWRLN